MIEAYFRAVIPIAIDAEDRQGADFASGRRYGVLKPANMETAAVCRDPEFVEEHSDGIRTVTRTYAGFLQFLCCDAIFLAAVGVEVFKDCAIIFRRRRQALKTVECVIDTLAVRVLQIPQGRERQRSTTPYATFHNIAGNRFGMDSAYGLAQIVKSRGRQHRAGIYFPDFPYHLH